MSKVIVPRIGGILEHRQDRIAQDLDKAHRLKAEADNAIAAYEQELAEAQQGFGQRRSATRRVTKAKAAAEAERQKVNQARQEAVRRRGAHRAIRDQGHGRCCAIAAKTTEPSSSI
jgi:F-type H+-transporting ATPase subunit b